MATVLTERGPVDVEGAEVRGEDLWLPAGEVERATGWSLKPQGLCRGDRCVPVPAGRESAFTSGERVNAAAFWRQMGAPVLHDASRSVWILGESASARAEALTSLEAPDFTLPDLDGAPHSLSDYRGKKVLLVTWASW